MGTRFIFLRHGQIKANRTGHWHGSTDSQLTWLGRGQAKRTRRYFKKAGPEITHAYSSPLQRCQKTADIATRHLKLDIDTLDGVAEMSIGAWENKPFDELRSEYGLFEKISADADFRPPDGESIADVSSRFAGAITAVAEQHEEEDCVLIVTHGFALAIYMATLLDQNPLNWAEYNFHNCSISEIELVPGPKVHRLNQYGHL